MKYIDINQNIKDINNFNSNTILYVGQHKKKITVVPGVYDVNHNVEKILIQKCTMQNLEIQKGERLASSIPLNQTKIFNTKEIDSTWNEKEILKCYKGNVENKPFFEKTIKEISQTEIQYKPLNFFHDINLKDEKKQIYIKPYRTNIKNKELIEENIEKMLENNIIRNSKSNYSSPVVLVKKNDGSYRFCVDYRQLSSNTIRDVYPLPRIDDILDYLKEAKYFSKIDLKCGYWQIPIEEKDKHKTAFSTYNGLFEFTKMPFGLSNAPATFQRIMNNLLTKSNGIFSIVYLDDILIFSKDNFSHIDHIEYTFKIITT